ncbi:DoxX family protein [Pseudomaricurvus sp.]|uniref:DoxX family protein n=1 Tax=Pseudomaricurvus sp. TaxID=2004510 RepID=UPI003F6C3ADF
MKAFLNKSRPHVLSLLRIVTGFMFMQHGAQKIFGYPVAQRYEFELISMSGAAGVLELLGGFLFLIGLFTRSVAFILSGLMAVAYFMVHAPSNFWPIANGGELAAMFSFVFFYFVFSGPGVWSLDNLRK